MAWSNLAQASSGTPDALIWIRVLFVGGFVLATNAKSIVADAHGGVIAKMLSIVGGVLLL